MELFLKLKNCSVVCLWCGISRPTLRKWVRQFQENGLDGLRTESKRPKSSPPAKLADKQREWIRELRTCGLGSRRIQNELKRIHASTFPVRRSTKRFEPWRRNRCFAGLGAASTSVRLCFAAQLGAIGTLGLGPARTEFGRKNMRG